MSALIHPIHPRAASLQRQMITLFSFRFVPLLLVLPLTVILMRIFLWSVPPFLTNLLVVNACLILFFVLGRLLLIVEEMWRGMIPRPVKLKKKQHGVLFSPSEEAEVVTLTCNAGFRYQSEAGYGVRWSPATIVAVPLILFGMLLAIPTGIYDYFHQFSGLIVVGEGNATPLNLEGNYSFYSKGPLAHYSDITYKIKGYPLFPPSATYPFGAKELSVLDLSGKEQWTGILQPGERHVEGKYAFYFDNFIYDIFLALTTTEKHYVIGEFVRCKRLDTGSGPYTHYGIFYNEKVKGEVWYDPASDRMVVRATIDGKKQIQAVVGMGPEHIKEVDGIVINNNGIGKWSQINVLRLRHLGLLKTGVALCLVGTILYLLAPVRRIWVTRDDKGLSVWSDDHRFMNRIARLTGGAV